MDISPPVFFLPEEPGLDPAEARRRLSSLTGRARISWLARLMRGTLPSRFFVHLASPETVNAEYDRVRPHLGRARSLWDWVILGGRRQGLLSESN